MCEVTHWDLTLDFRVWNMSCIEVVHLAGGRYFIRMRVLENDSLDVLFMHIKGELTSFSIMK